MFLSIITRHMSYRKILLYRLMASLEMQTDQDFEHIIIENEPTGLENANKSFFKHRDEVHGEYVYMIDDDDFLCDPQFIEQLGGAVIGEKCGELADVVIFRLQSRGVYGDGKVPQDDAWEDLKAGGHPQCGKISTPCFIVRRELWYKYIENFGIWRSGDYNFINSVFSGEPDLKVAFRDRTPVILDRVGSKGEEEPMPDRLQIGSGDSPHQSGWLNLDFLPSLGVDIICDLSKDIIPLPDNCMQEIYSHHVLEHFLPWRLDEILKDCFRILVSGGQFNATIPDLIGSAKNLISGQYTEDAMCCIYGGAGRGYKPPESHIHLWGYTEATIKEKLANAGFTDIVTKAYGDSIPVIDINAKKP